jgi:plasmid stabilization system protein ParE
LTPSHQPRGRQRLESIAVIAQDPAIQTAVASLAAHPLIGRRIYGEIRELVISFGKSGPV